MPENDGYYESETKRKWQKENSIVIGIKLQKKGDKELLDYLDAKSESTGLTKPTLFKLAMLKQMDSEKKDTKN